MDLGKLQTELGFLNREAVALKTQIDVFQHKYQRLTFLKGLLKTIYTEYFACLAEEKDRTQLFFSSSQLGTYKTLTVDSAIEDVKGFLKRVGIEENAMIFQKYDDFFGSLAEEDKKTIEELRKQNPTADVCLILKHKPIPTDNTVYKQ